MSRLVNNAVYSIVKEEYKGQNISDAFLYLVKVVLLNKGYNKISVQELCRDFEEYCGFSIPYYPMTVILSTLRSQGYVKNGKLSALLPDLEKLRKEIPSSPLEKEQEHLNRIIDSFIAYASSMDSNYNFTSTDVELILDDFLDINGLNLLSSTYTFSTGPDDNRMRLFFRFLTDMGKSDPELVEFIGSLVVGRILTELFISGQNESPGKSRSNASVYLDTSVVFALLGIDMCDRTEVYRNLVNDTKKLGMRVKVFYHTYVEMLTLIDGSIPWLGNPYYDPVEATAATRYFVTHNFNAEEVMDYANDLEDSLKKHGIQIDRMDYPNPYSIPRGVKTEQQYYEQIVKRYKEAIPDFDEIAKRKTVDKDARTLFFIDYLNAGIRAPKMQDISNIFVTNNNSLASVSKDDVRYQRGAIPDCVSEVYWGTLIWLNDPNQLLTTTKVRVAANATAAFSPSSMLMRKLVASADKLQEEEKITPDEAFLLKSNPFAHTILMELTKGNDKYYTEKTPEEILQIIRQDALEEGKRQERQQTEALIRKKDEEIVNKQNQFDQYSANVEADKMQMEKDLAQVLHEKREIEAEHERWRRETILETIRQQETCQKAAEKKFSHIKTQLIIAIILAAIAISYGMYKLFYIGKADGVDYLSLVLIYGGFIFGLIQTCMLVFTGKHIDKNNIIANFMRKRRERINMKCGYDEMKLENCRQELQVVEEKIAEFEAEDGFRDAEPFEEGQTDSLSTTTA